MSVLHRLFPRWLGSKKKRLIVPEHQPLSHGAGYRFVYAETGEPAFPNWFSDARFFHYGFAAVKREGWWFFVDEKGLEYRDDFFAEVKDVGPQGHVWVKFMKNVSWSKWTLYHIPTATVCRIRR